MLRIHAHKLAADVAGRIAYIIFVIAFPNITDHISGRSHISHTASAYVGRYVSARIYAFVDIACPWPGCCSGFGIFSFPYHIAENGRHFTRITYEVVSAIFMINCVIVLQGPQCFRISFGVVIVAFLEEVEKHIAVFIVSSYPILCCSPSRDAACTEALRHQRMQCHHLVGIFDGFP